MPRECSGRGLRGDALRLHPSTGTTTNLRLDGKRVRSAGGALLAAACLALLSATLSWWYAATRFVPDVPFESDFDSYDAFRYDHWAQLLSRLPLERILQERIWQVHDAGYVRFLAVLYSVLGHDPLLGCLVNWLLWLAAGLALSPIAASDGAGRRPGTAFLAVWLLLPDAIDWTGTTSKEPLCALLLAGCLRLAWAVERAKPSRVVTLGAAVVGTALLGGEVRAALLGLAVVPFAVALEVRLRRSRLPWTVVGAILILATAFLGFSGDALGSFTNTDFSATGHAHATETWGSGFSRDSVLLRLGSDDKWLDLLAVPVRGLAHVVVPLNTPPTALPLARVSAPSLLQWASAAFYSFLAIAIGLRVREHARPAAPALPSRDVVLLGTALVALVLLGLTGIIHERYRSILVPALVPLGMRYLVEETAAHGTRRLVASAASLAVLCTVGYLGLKYVF